MHAKNAVPTVTHSCSTRSAARAGLSAAEERRLRDALRRRSPSEPWVDAQFKSTFERDERGRPFVRRVHDSHVFPPGGDQTAMVRCPMCTIFTPPGGMENGLCLDHAEHESWGPSPSAEAIRGLQYRNLRFTECELAPESTAALRREIRRKR